MSDLASALPFIGAIIVFGALVLGSGVRPSPVPVRIKRPGPNRGPTKQR